MCSQYKVPVIPQNLSKEETIVQIAEVLNYISEITEDVFKTVNTRIKLNEERLGSVSKRLDSACSKINNLKGAKKATQVFSSSKYPASDINVDYVSIFEQTAKLELKRHKLESQHYVLTNEPLDKLQFYHVKLSNNREKASLDGLGAIPSNVSNVNDLLLYNSGKNLYKNFVISDSLKGPENTRKTNTQNASKLGAAPLSISERSTLAKQSKENYFYNPKIEELPALDVPLDLPDLPGIADDLRYESDVTYLKTSGIAPSSVTISLIENIEDLPTIVETENIRKPIDIPDMLPPPPPPPPENIPPPLNLPPPPPIAPPLPNYEVVAPNKSSNSEKETTSSVPPPQPDLRANLMEAIRQAGGTQKAKLRSAKPEIKEVTSKPPAGDLMADLHSKLLMRRKGLSGTKKVEQENSFNAETTMAKISAMIPAPVKTETDDSSTDEEWN